MAKNKLETREQLTRKYLDDAIRSPGVTSIEKIVKEVELIVDAIMRSRKCDMDGEFYIAVDNILGDNDGKD